MEMVDWADSLHFGFSFGIDYSIQSLRSGTTQPDQSSGNVSKGCLVHHLPNPSFQRREFFAPSR